MLEQQVIERRVLESEAVIATGGGAVLLEANRNALRSRTTVIYIHCAPESLVRRLRPDGRRPLLSGENLLDKLKTLFADRDPLYRQTAHCVLEGEGLTPASAARRLRADLNLVARPARSSADLLRPDAGGGNAT